MKSFQELSRTKEASVDKCIKCSKKFCNIFWKTWLAEPFPVNVLELQPAFLLKKGRLSQIISKVAVRKCSLKCNCFETFHKFPGNHPWWSVFVSWKLKKCITLWTFSSEFSHIFQNSLFNTFCPEVFFKIAVLKYLWKLPGNYRPESEVNY